MRVLLLLLFHSTYPIVLLRYTQPPPNHLIGKHFLVTMMFGI